LIHYVEANGHSDRRGENAPNAEKEMNMPDPTSTEFVASRERPKNGYGQVGYQGSASLTPGQTKSPIADVSPPTCNVPGLAGADQLSARVKMGDDGRPASPPLHMGAYHRTVSDGSPGGPVPSSLSRTPKR
jgi:hypothetical protein